MKKLPFYFIDGTTRSTSGLGLGKLLGLNGVKWERFWDNFSEAGRGLIDSAAGALGLPAATIRQSIRNYGVDPDQLEATIIPVWETTPPESPDEANAQIGSAMAQMTGSSTKPGPLMIGLAAAALLISSGMLFKRGGRRKGFRRGRSFRRRF